MNNKIQLIVVASPSGGGKSTLAKHLLSELPELQFSVSATTRKMRPGEINGREYHFLSKEEFTELINQNLLIEFEEIFGNYYGTLKTVTDTLLQEGKIILFDVDVKGALSIKKIYGNKASIIFITPPSLEILEHRLRTRNTESEEQLQLRLSRAIMELRQKDNFDYLLINDELEKAKNEIYTYVSKLLI